MPAPRFDVIHDFAAECDLNLRHRLKGNPMFLRFFRRRTRPIRRCADLPPHLLRDVGLESCLDRPRLNLDPLWRRRGGRS